VVLSDFELNAEIAQNYHGRSGNYFDRHANGGYVQAAYTVGKTTLAARYDYARVGTYDGPLDKKQQGVATVRYSPMRSWSVRGEVAVPLDATENTKILSMASFVF